MEISLFDGMTSKRPISGSIESVVQTIREDPKLASFTQSYRLTGNKDFKHEAPLFAVAVIFEGGKGQANIKGLTGLSLVDFDHVFESHTDCLSLRPAIFNSTDLTDSSIMEALRELKRKICDDPHTLLCYITMSGNGLRVIYRYELPSEEQENSSLSTHHSSLLYSSAFAMGNAYYEHLTGKEADPQCKNITRLSGLAYDPEVYFNPDAIAFTAEEIGKFRTHSAKEDKEQRQLKRIEEYYQKVICPKLANDNIRFEPGSHNEYVMRTGYLLAQKRYNRATAMKWAKKVFAQYKDTEQVFRSCFDAYAKEHGSRSGGDGGGGDGKAIRFANVEEIKTFLDGHVKLRFNEVTLRVEFQSSTLWIPINDRKVNSLWAEMSIVSRVSKQDLFNVIDSDYVKSFHPFREYLESLPQISQIHADSASGISTSVRSTELKIAGRRERQSVCKNRDPIRELANSVRVKGGEETQERWYQCLRKWLVAMVAAWLEDDVVNNVILVLIGEQGAYKTTWFSNLLPPELRQYFYVKTNANRLSKDDLLTLAMYGLVCCEELDTMRPSELNQLKAAVTMPSIDERAAYAHYHEHRMHIASFCGTGNNIQFLTDPTGNRRWLPFEVESIRSPREYPFDHAAIFAEAYALYKSGFRYWFTQDEVREQNAYNQLFETPRLELELVDLYFRKPLEGENGEFMTVARAMQLISCGISQKLNSTNVSRAFSELGFKRVRTNKSRGYLVVCRTAEEMKAYQKTMALNAERDG